MKSTGILAALLLLLGCQGEKIIPAGMSRGQTPALHLPPNMVVLTEPRDRRERKTFHFILQYELADVAFSTLSDREVALTDSLLQESLKAYNAEVRRSGYLHNLVDLTDYKRQLLAYINPQGEKEVWVNCLRSIQEEYGWRTYPVLLFDGGNSVYTGRINLSLRKWHDFHINPEG